MKVFLLQDVEKMGIAGEIVKVGDGFARNYLIPRKLGIEITAKNSSFYEKKSKTVENRKEAVATKTSMLAEKIKSLKLILKRKVHDGGKLYGSVGQGEVSDLLSEQGISVAKNKVLFNKSIKEKGTYDVTIKLSSSLQPKLKLTIVPESSA